MNNRRVFALRLLVAGLPLAGCTPSSTPEVSRATTISALTKTSTTDPVSGTSFDLGDPPDDTESCPQTRLIGKASSSGACPGGSLIAGLFGSWSVSKLFDTTGGFVPAGLARYCVYEWSSPTSAPQDTTVLPLDGHAAWSDWLSGDCNVVAALGHPYADDNAQRFRDAFMLQAEHLLRLPPTPRTPPRIQVLVADSSVDAPPPQPGVGQLDHGRDVGLMINAMTCPSPNDPSSLCAGEVAHALALPLVGGDGDALVRDTINGGFFGSQGDVAKAAFEGVRKLRPTADRIVVNLSIGWSGAYGGPYAVAPSELDAPARAVHEALEVIACQGALVIAAAGNASGGHPSQTGPAYPGGWESVQAPTTGRCGDLGVSGPPASPRATYRPLLYAAGGVDGRDRPFFGARSGGLPRLVAPAAVGVVRDTALSTWTDPMTGTSVSTAVVSAAATLAWTYNPALSPHDVMEMVFGASVRLSLPTDFCAGLECDAARRVSLCHTTAAACQRAGVCSSAAVGCPPHQAGRDARAHGFIARPQQGEIRHSGVGLTVRYLVGSPCSAFLSTDRTDEPFPCPSGQFYNGTHVPWAVPQPDKPPCPVCFIMPQTVALGINPAFVGALSDPVLHIDGVNGPESFTLPIASTALTPGSTHKVENLAFDINKVTAAKIEFLVDGHTARADELLFR